MLILTCALSLSPSFISLFRKGSTGDGPREGELEDLHEDEPSSWVCRPQNSVPFTSLCLDYCSLTSHTQACFGFLLPVDPFLFPQFPSSLWSLPALSVIVLPAQQLSAMPWINQWEELWSFSGSKYCCRKRQGNVCSLALNWFVVGGDFFNCMYQS